MSEIVQDRTVAELLALDLAPGVLGFPTDDTASVVVFTGLRAIQVGVAGEPAATAFTGLTDTPASFAGQGTKLVRVNAAANGLEFVDAPATATFLGLPDTPASFASQAGKYVRVNSSNDGLEFVTLPAAITTVVGLSDTAAGPPSFGQGLVWTEDGLGAGQDGFAYSTFINVQPTGSPYALNRVLVSDGTAYVDVPGVPAPVGAVDGQLPWWNQVSGEWELLDKGAAGTVLVGGDGAGAPSYASFQTLLNSATQLDTNLSTDDLALSEDRLVDVGAHVLTMSRGSDMSVVVDGLNKRVVLGGRDGANGMSMIGSSLGVQFNLFGTAGLAFWNPDLDTPAYEFGTVGQSIVAQATGTPKWGNPRLILQSPNETQYEITVSDTGELILDVPA